MRTIGQQNSEDAMLKALKTLTVRPTPTLFEDAAGVVMLFVLLFAALSMSGAA